MPSERKIEAAVCGYARSLGWLVFKWVSPNERGVPDRIFMKDSRIIFIEFKAPGKDLSPLQAIRRVQIQQHGFDVLVVNDIDKGRQLIDAATQLPTPNV